MNDEPPATGPSDDAGYLLAGRFGAAARLSPKALRLYAGQGLLAPAHTDPATGYRYYHPDQVPRARLIARLRRLDLPLARIAGLLDLPAADLAVELRCLLRERERELARYAEDVEAIARRAEGTGGPAPAIALREVPARKVLGRERRVFLDGLDPFIDGAKADIRAHLRAAGAAADEPARVHFHGLVTRDSDGPVEVAVPFTGAVDPVGDLRIRLEPAHTEAYLPVPRELADFPEILRAYDAIEDWMDARPGVTCLDSPLEVHPGTDGAFLDVAYPIAIDHRQGRT